MNLLFNCTDVGGDQSIQYTMMMNVFIRFSSQATRPMTRSSGVAARPGKKTADVDDSAVAVFGCHRLPLAPGPATWCGKTPLQRQQPKAERYNLQVGSMTHRTRAHHREQSSGFARTPSKKNNTRTHRAKGKAQEHKDVLENNVWVSPRESKMTRQRTQRRQGHEKKCPGEARSRGQGSGKHWHNAAQQIHCTTAEPPWSFTQWSPRRTPKTGAAGTSGACRAGGAPPPTTGSPGPTGPSAPGL